MKKNLSILFAFIGVSASAQVNVQMHYDFGGAMNSDLDGRQKITTTIEMFKPDQLGSTFFFVDFDYKADGVVAAYMEASREFTFMKINDNSSLAAHVEYNGGVCNAASYQQAGLLGAAWNWHSDDFSKTFSLQGMYRQAFGQKGGREAFGGVQLTGVWGVNLAKSVTFSGFFDFWTDSAVKNKFIFFSEPQLWYNFTPQFSLGTEWELTKGFYAPDKFYVNPTIAVKYNF